MQGPRQAGRMPSTDSMDPFGSISSGEQEFIFLKDLHSRLSLASPRTQIIKQRCQCHALVTSRFNGHSAPAVSSALGRTHTWRACLIHPLNAIHLQISIRRSKTFALRTEQHSPTYRRFLLNKQIQCTVCISWKTAMSFAHKERIGPTSTPITEASSIRTKERKMSEQYR